MADSRLIYISYETTRYNTISALLHLNCSQGYESPLLSATGVFGLEILIIIFSLSSLTIHIGPKLSSLRSSIFPYRLCFLFCFLFQTLIHTSSAILRFYVSNVFSFGLWVLSHLFSPSWILVYVTASPDIAYPFEPFPN